MQNTLIDNLGSDPRQYREMMQLYDGAIREVRTKLEVLKGEFGVRYARNPIHSIESRLKSAESIVDKLRRKGVEPTLEAAEEYLTDIAGVRVVCSFVDDIYRVADLLTRQRDVELVETADYIKNPKPSGYRSLHLIIRIPVFLSSHTEIVPVEVQIRTLAMDFWATLEHQLRYKSDQETTRALRKRLCRCADISAALDEEMQQISREIISDS